ncbi:DUF1127 domain-containing protein [Mesorhizobium sp. WSM3859]|uniref:DUF1127 domain-containing protein n=1 Tax=Mesorhizobium sp. WSM3859 TaxID=2029402 RepID=UPI000BAF46B1|nr:DUF1127 domain-containing protein [Mesorhizobium sp. WSM3859]PBC06662.1 hypothetical protein CK230_30510 [Mesorhizobium sp. WSM3859]
MVAPQQMETTMTTLEHTAFQTGRAGSGPIGFAGRAFRFFDRAMRMRRDRAALQAMPDFLLKDMGIARSEIDRYTAMLSAASTRT